MLEIAKRSRPTSSYGLLSKMWWMWTMYFVNRSVKVDLVCERGIFQLQLKCLIANQSLNFWNKAYQQYKQDSNAHDCWYLAVTASPTEKRPDCLEQGSEFLGPSLHFAQNFRKAGNEMALIFEVLGCLMEHWFLLLLSDGITIYS